MNIGKLHLSVNKYDYLNITLGEKMLSVTVDLDDEPGDPSGLYLVLCGYTIQAYYPTHIPFGFCWGIGQRFVRTR